MAAAVLFRRHTRRVAGFEQSVCHLVFDDCVDAATLADNFLCRRYPASAAVCETAPCTKETKIVLACEEEKLPWFFPAVVAEGFESSIHFSNSHV